MEYEIFTASSGFHANAIKQIVDIINDKIKQGYKPLGNLSVVERSGVFYFAQVMIKEE